MDQQTRTEILAAADDLFQQHGYRRVTMDQIARRRGMSKRTLYQYFASKQEVADGVVAARLADWLRQADAAFAAGGTFPEVFSRLLRGVEVALAELNPLFLEDLERYAPGVFARIAEARGRQMLRLAGLLQAGQAEGSVRPDVRADLAIDFLIAAVQAAGRPEWLRRRRIGFPELITTVQSLFLYGVCARG